jgi:hypothetical protein
MSKFPLYDNLSKDIPEDDLTLAQKRNFVKRVDKSDQEGHNLIYALIKMYNIEEKDDDDTNTSFTLPYNGLYVERDILFDIDNFPIPLKHILYRFSTAHVVKMKEEEHIAKQTPVKRF